MMSSTADGARHPQLLPRVQSHLDELVRTCAQIKQPLVSVILFGSAASGRISSASDVDVMIVVPDGTTLEAKRELGAQVARLEIAHGFRPARRAGALQARIERSVGHLFSCFICTHSDLITGDVARILDLRR